MSELSESFHNHTSLKETTIFRGQAGKGHLTGHFAHTLGRGRGYVIKLWSEITLVAVQSAKGHICFTKPF